MLDAERALANAEAIAGAIPADAAAAISDSCRAELFDIERAVAAGPRDRQSRRAARARAARASRRRRGSLRPLRCDEPGHPRQRGDARRARTRSTSSSPSSTASRPRARGSPRRTARRRWPARTLLQQAVPTTFGAEGRGLARRRRRGAARLDELGRAAPGAARRRGRDARAARRHGHRSAAAVCAGARPRRSRSCRGTRTAAGSPSSARRWPSPRLPRRRSGSTSRCSRRRRSREVSRSARRAAPRRCRTSGIRCGSTLARACALRVHAASDVLTGGVARARARGGRVARGMGGAVGRARATPAARPRRCARRSTALEVHADRMRANMRDETLAERIGSWPPPEDVPQSFSIRRRTSARRARSSTARSRSTGSSCDARLPPRRARRRTRARPLRWARHDDGDVGRPGRRVRRALSRCPPRSSRTRHVAAAGRARHDRGDRARAARAAGRTGHPACVVLRPVAGRDGRHVARARTRPDRIERLVLACTGATLGTVESFAERAALVRREGLDGVATERATRWFTPSLSSRPRGGAHHRRAFATRRARVTPRCCEAVGNFDFTAELHRVTPPTLVLTGAEDPVTPPPVVEALVHGIPGASSSRSTRPRTWRTSSSPTRSTRRCCATSRKGQPHE